jgi:hypothetical protein
VSFQLKEFYHGVNSLKLHAVAILLARQMGVFPAAGQQHECGYWDDGRDSHGMTANSYLTAVF